MPSYYNPYQGYYQPQNLPQIQYPATQQTAQMNMPNQNQQIQNGGFISVPSEDIVKTYPVAPGNCVTFKIEGKPIVMEKSMGFSQLEAPKVERYRLVKEEPSETTQEPQIETQKTDIENSSIKKIKAEIEAIWNEIEDIKSTTKKPSSKRKGMTEDDPE